VAVDVDSGALVRSRASGWPEPALDTVGGGGVGDVAVAVTVNDREPPDFRPSPKTVRELDIVDIELADDDEPSDPARPEAIMVLQAPVRVGTPRRRATRRILQELVPIDPTRPLLGSLGPSISYEDLDGSRPSVAVIAPDRTPVFASDTKGTWCQFSVGGRRHRLGVVDERITGVTALERSGALSSAAVSGAIGGVPRYLIIGLGAPRRGQAPKLVLGVLPRP